jgi:WD40 repeat protein
MLCVGLAIATVYGYRQARTAQTQAQIAEQRRREAAESADIARRQGAIALSRQLAANSTYFLTRDADLSLLLAVEATQRQDTLEARKALFAALAHLGHAETFLHVSDGQVAAVGFGADLRPLALTRQLVRDATGNVVGNAMRLWDLRAGKALGSAVTETRAGDNWIPWSSRNPALTPGPPSGKVARFSSDGRQLAVATCLYSATMPATRTDQGSSVCANAWIRIYAVTVDGLQHTRSFDNVGWAEELAYSHDSQTLNVRACHRSKAGLDCSDRGNSAFDVRAGQPDAVKPANRVRELTFLSPPELVKQLRLPADIEVTRLAFGSDDRHVALGLADGRLLIIDAEVKALVQVLNGHSSAISDLSFSSDRTHLISASADGTILVHRVGQEHQLSRLLGRHDHSAEAVSFRPDGQVVISGGWDGTIRFWNAYADDRRTHIGTIEDGLRSRVSCVSYSPDAKTVSSTSDNVVSGSTVTQFWDAQTHKPIGRPVSTGGRTCRGFSPLNDVIALEDYGKVFLLDWRARKRIGADIPAAKGWVTDLFFRGSQETLLSADIEGRVMAWDLRKTIPAGRLLAQFHQMLNATALNREQTMMAAGGDGWADLLELDTGGVSNLPLKFAGSVVGVAFHPSDPVLVVGTRDAIFLWDLQYSELIGELLRTPHRLNRLAVSPDGGTIAGGYDDGSVLLWSLALRNWRTIACRMVNRHWTDEEWRRFVGEADNRAECLQPAS